MRASIAAAATAALSSLASARITGISVPETIKPGDTIDAIIVSSNYIQSVYDVSIAFGYFHGKGIPQSLGFLAGSMYLGPSTLLPTPPNKTNKHHVIQFHKKKGS